MAFSCPPSGKKEQEIVDQSIQAVECFHRAPEHHFNLRPVSWPAKMLCPLLSENHLVTMDNVPFHKSVQTRERTADTGAMLLFLFPYSLDLNPIEKNFANIKKRVQRTSNTG